MIDPLLMFYITLKYLKVAVPVYLLYLFSVECLPVLLTPFAFLVFYPKLWTFLFLRLPFSIYCAFCQLTKRKEPVNRLRYLRFLYSKIILDAITLGYFSRRHLPKGCPKSAEEITYPILDKW